MATNKKKQQTKAELIEQLGELFRINGSQDIAFDTVAAERLGINRTDLNCIDVIERHGGVTAGQLAAEAGLTTGAVTAVIDRLERAGYARRVRDDEDRRRVKVEVTPKLENEAGKIYGPLMEEFQAVMNGATAEQLRVMIEFLRRANEVTPRHIERVRAMRAGRGSEGGEGR
jgi:DNA-binding MarR family transcriptional regulator